MPFSVEPLVKEDFQDLYKLIHSKDGHLSSPAADMSWLATTDEEAQKRHAWSLKQQQDMLENDPTAHNMKAVDTETGAIAAIARWHYYPDGYTINDLEFAGVNDKHAASSYPVTGMNVALYKGLLDSFLDNRASWMGDGSFWVLTTIRTREPERRKGAGGLLVEWGIKKAREQGCAAYLEAVPDAAHLYESKGFKAVGSPTIDMEPWGVPSKITYYQMKA